jgi:hypothetical protein
VVKKLVNLLLAKSIIETIFVGTLAVLVYTRAFPPTFHGWAEAVVEEKAIYGWVVNNARPDEYVEVEVYVDGRYSGRDLAAGPRPDIVAAGWSKNPYHGYAVWMSKLPPGKHEVRVYALHRSDDGRKYTLQLVGDPVQFENDVRDNWKRR